MAGYEVAPSPETVHWGHLDATLTPTLEIESGDTLTLHSVSGSPDEAPDSRFTLRPELAAIHAARKPELGPHILTGPVFVRGARPGDALKVEILDVSLRDDWGFNLTMAGKGALPDEFPEHRYHLAIDRERRTITAPWGLTFDARPFFGIMAVAPAPDAGRITSVIPGTFGGNIDNKELCAGATLWLPVAAEGALFSAGDGHASQGDGEVCLTAGETGLTGTFRLTVEPGAAPDGPVAETPTHLIAMAFDEDLDEAARMALRSAIRLIVALSGLSPNEAYALISMAADLRVTQLVNVKKGAHVMIPKALLAAPA